MIRTGTKWSYTWTPTHPFGIGIRRLCSPLPNRCVSERLSGAFCRSQCQNLLSGEPSNVVAPHHLTCLPTRGQTSFFRRLLRQPRSTVFLLIIRLSTSL